MPVRFYCCYLLQSTPKPTSFYIGSTPDPFRRLRQHNGELTQGAYKTSSAAKRPWKMICCISGFQSQVAALQFEHAWQHPYQTRHIPKENRIVNSRSQMYRSLDKYIGNLRLLASADAFSRMPLTVHLLEEVALMAWMKNKFKIAIPEYVHVEEDIRPNIGRQDDDLPPIGGGKLKLYTTQYSVSKLSELYCNYKKEDQQGAVCPSCHFEVDLTKFASTLLENCQDQVIPRSGSCPSCQKPIEWSVIAHFAKVS
ncbi:Slx1p [Sugiyamaella lignohabitans]|uniref:Slx1p n=1 Tax=Sugiyamaella lignohabitans TaxID=796027 RepID=A0A167FIK7_9ASCO|nr:Slx1p [Sugiyamaella lignohabitans]ANB15346.1 Slx1p [Sugiyamaella lignohabitans]